MCENHYKHNFPLFAPREHVSFYAEMEQKLSEERLAKMRLENRILELEKHSSMMDCDYKQALQKLEELRRHKDHLTEEVSPYAGPQSSLLAF